MNKKTWFMRHKWLLVGIMAMCIAVFALRGTITKSDKKSFVTMDITRGNISQTVTATGEIQPLNTVNVGSQVSGTIAEIYADYNSQVKQGDILLKIVQLLI